MPSKDTLKFRFDVSAYRLLGRELITDRITALFELVKNAYDANADEVKVSFHSVNPKSETSTIILKDDGLGMTFEDLRDKWMVIGTSSKRRDRTSPAPYNRKVVGKKGVGRFAVDKLGAKLLLKSTRKGSDKMICLETDWSFYEELEKDQLQLEKADEGKFFTDIENKYWFEDADFDQQGTELVITKVSDTWIKSDIARATKELAKLISPNHHSKYPFEIVIDAEDYPEYRNYSIKSIGVQYATEEIHLKFDLENQKQEILWADNGILRKRSVDLRPCGPIEFKLYYYDLNAKKKFRQAFPESQIDGVKVYRDGIVATPFAEYKANRDEQRDLFGIDKRRWSGFFDKLGSRDLLGWVELKDEFNPDIIDATNRQDFVDNLAWQELKAFVIEQIAELEKVNEQRRNQKKVEIDNELKEAGDDLGSIRKEINELGKVASPELKSSLELLEKKVAQTQISVNKGLRSKIELEERKQQQENLLFSLISLQTFSSTLAHITRTIIGRIKRTAEFFKDRFPDPKYDTVFKNGAEKIFFEMERLSNAIDFMLKYAKSDSTVEAIEVKSTLEHLFHNIHEYTFQQEGIRTELIVKNDLIINYNQTAFEDIIENLISNSIKALKDTESEKFIRCECLVENDKLIILFSDNGCGVKEEDRYRIFDVFYTTTAEYGGAGMGLFIVTTRLEAVQGSIELIDSEFTPAGATFRLTIPFKK